MNTDNPAASNVPEVTGIILAGGQGRRMNNRDKGWITLGGKPLIAHVVQRLNPQVDRLLISANRHLDKYRALGYPVLPDADKPPASDDRYQGPIAGITRCLEKVATDYAVIVPCDAPLLPSDLVATLLQHSSGGKPLVLFEVNGRLQPLFGLYHRSLGTSLNAYFQAGERKLITWCLQQNPAIITLEEENPGFSNINSPAELAEIEQRS